MSYTQRQSVRHNVQNNIAEQKSAAFLAGEALTRQMVGQWRNQRESGATDEPHFSVMITNSHEKENCSVNGVRAVGKKGGGAGSDPNHPNDATKDIKRKLMGCKVETGVRGANPKDVESW